MIAPCSSRVSWMRMALAPRSAYPSSPRSSRHRQVHAPDGECIARRQGDTEQPPAHIGERAECCRPATTREAHDLRLCLGPGALRPDPTTAIATPARSSCFRRVPRTKGALVRKGRTSSGGRRSRSLVVCSPPPRSGLVPESWHQLAPPSLRPGLARRQASAMPLPTGFWRMTARPLRRFSSSWRCSSSMGGAQRKPKLTVPSFDWTTWCSRCAWTMRFM